MKITFISNYLNHHQSALCEALYRELDGNFRFVACMPVPQVRKQLGYLDMNQKEYVIRAYEGNEQRNEGLLWCLESDVIIHGSAPEFIVERRISMGRPVFRYSERIFKKGLIHVLSPRGQKNLRLRHTQYKDKLMYMLCSSAYTAKDLSRVGAYNNKAFRWGYFPEVKTYEDIDALMGQKEPASILWVARLIELKHPEAALEVAQRLKKDGYKFKLSLIGIGPMQEQLEQMISKNGLCDCVELLGSMSPEQVRAHMEKAEIFLFNSDRHEGWGAVMNESMNSGCAVVASHIVGSVPFLVQDGQNGLIYKSGNTKDLYKKVKSLLDNPQKRAQMGKAAYETMVNQWNAENAAKRFIELAHAVCDGTEYPDLFEDGVCSKAPLLRDHWYK